MNSIVEGTIRGPHLHQLLAGKDPWSYHFPVWKTIELRDISPREFMEELKSRGFNFHHFKTREIEGLLKEIPPIKRPHRVNLVTVQTEDVVFDSESYPIPEFFEIAKKRGLELCHPLTAALVRLCAAPEEGGWLYFAMNPILYKEVWHRFRMSNEGGNHWFSYGEVNEKGGTTSSYDRWVFQLPGKATSAVSPKISVKRNTRDHDSEYVFARLSEPGGFCNPMKLKLLDEE